MRVPAAQSSLFGLFCCLLIVTLTAGQEPAARPTSQPFAAAVSAVVIDAVVRDGSGRPVTDLRKEDFELLEDGVVQVIGDVATAGVSDEPTAGRPAVPSDRLSPDTDAASSTAAATTGPTFTAIVFDRLTPGARALAYDGAQALVVALQPNDYAAVYLSDLSLTTIQTYTNDRGRLDAAVRDVASRVTSAFDRTATRSLLDSGRLSESVGDGHPSVPTVASPESVGRPAEFILPGRRVMPEQMAMMDVLVRHTWEAMARDQQGYATTNALLAVTTGLGLLPGRKTLVLFAEGLAIPEVVLPHFRNVVANANRGNVSVYTVDAAGLRVHSKDAETGREVKAMGDAGLTVGLDGSNQSSLRMLERNEDVLRRDPRTSLTLLARETGGILIDGTNDLADALRQVEGDRRFHYLLTYTPKKTDFDGAWRSVTVRVPGRRVQVRARSGYLAVNAPATLPLLAYEGPALAALQRSPSPTELPLRARVLVFPGREHPSVAVLAATDGASLRFDTHAGAYRTDFSILARIVDSRGDVVRKSSQPYRLGGPVSALEGARRGEILFYRQPVLEPGTYTLEVAVHDVLAGRSGVYRQPFTVPAVTPDALQVGSLVLVARAERVSPSERQPDNPLFMGNVLVYPNLGEPIRKSRDKAVTCFVVALAGRGGRPEAAVEILSGDRIVAQAPVPLPAPDASGRIEHVVQVPVLTLSPGRYSVRLTVGQGPRREAREAAFELVD